MAIIYSTMGMDFPKGSEPDFGSIRQVRVYEDDIREYLLNSADVAKLDLITNANNGSTAFCTDTSDLYVMHMGQWKKVGESSE